MIVPVVTRFQVNATDVILAPAVSVLPVVGVIPESMAMTVFGPGLMSVIGVIISIAVMAIHRKAVTIAMEMGMKTMMKMIRSG